MLWWTLATLGLAQEVPGIAVTVEADPDLRVIERVAGVRLRDTEPLCVGSCATSLAAGVHHLAVLRPNGWVEAGLRLRVEDEPIALEARRSHLGALAGYGAVQLLALGFAYGGAYHEPEACDSYAVGTDGLLETTHGTRRCMAHEGRVQLADYTVAAALQGVSIPLLIAGLPTFRKER